MLTDTSVVRRRKPAATGDSKHVPDQTLKPLRFFCGARGQATGDRKRTNTFQVGARAFNIFPHLQQPKRNIVLFALYIPPAWELALVIYSICLPPIFRTRLP